MDDENEKDTFNFENFSLQGLPKRCTRCTVIQPTRKHWKMGRFELLHTERVKKTATLIVQ